MKLKNIYMKFLWEISEACCLIHFVTDIFSKWLHRKLIFTQQGRKVFNMLNKMNLSLQVTGHTLTFWELTQAFWSKMLFPTSGLKEQGPSWLWGCSSITNVAGNVADQSHRKKRGGTEWCGSIRTVKWEKKFSYPSFWNFLFHSSCYSRPGSIPSPLAVVLTSHIPCNLLM